MEELDAAGLLVTAARPRPRTLVFEDLGSLHCLSACIKACPQPTAIRHAGRARLSFPCP